MSWRGAELVLSLLLFVYVAKQYTVYSASPSREGPSGAVCEMAESSEWGVASIPSSSPQQTNPYHTIMFATKLIVFATIAVIAVGLASFVSLASAATVVGQ